LVEKVTGVGIPILEEALANVRNVKPLRMKFRDDGYIPNNPKLPLLFYRKALRFSRKYDPAAMLEVVFNAHSWGQAWRNGIYDFVHYHSMIHEVLGIAKGSRCYALAETKERR
jgi:uncharacterized protein YjlB